MDEPRDWAGSLPEDARTEIVRRLPCRTDRGTMAAVCRAWRALVQILQNDDHPPPPPPLPWLLIPAIDSTRIHCFLSNYHAHHDIDPPLPHSARCFGSYDGAWLFIAYQQTRIHSILNLKNHDIESLPDKVDINGGVRRNMVMLAATLSAPPNDQNCVGACICIITRGPNVPSLRRIAFWNMGLVVANDPEPEPEPGLPAQEDFDWEVEDVVFYGDAFLFLTRGEHIFEYQLIHNGNMNLVPQYDGLYLFEPGGRNYDEFVVRARYLVVSGEELLMVVRFAPQPESVTSSFRVFRAMPPEQNPHPNGDEEDEDDQGGAEEDDEGEGLDQGEEVDDDQDTEEDNEGEGNDQGEEVDDDQDAEEDDEGEGLDQGEEVDDANEDAEEDDEGEGNDQGEEVDDDQDAEEVEDQVKDNGDIGEAEEDNLVEEAEFPWAWWSWDELDSLDGRMLFVGRGCSRSYGTAQYPGFSAGIYFLDDQTFYDEEVMFLGVNERQYPCDDNGKWSEGPPPVVKLCPPEIPSNHSSPVWVLP